MISIAHNGQELGQFSAEDVAAMLESGQIDQTVHYWTEGMTEWRPIVEIVQVDPVQPEAVVPTISKDAKDKAVEPVADESDIVQPYRWRRLAAAVVDIAVVVLIFFGIASVLPSAWQQTDGIFLPAVMMLFILLREPYKGRSLGKLLTGLVLADKVTMKPAGLWRSILHNLAIVGPVLLIVLVGFGVEKWFKSNVGFIIMGVAPLWLLIQLRDIFRGEYPILAEMASSTRVVTAQSASRNAPTAR
jgi:hypothetical protein